MKNCLVFLWKEEHSQVLIQPPEESDTANCIGIKMETKSNFYKSEIGQLYQSACNYNDKPMSSIITQNLSDFLQLLGLKTKQKIGRVIYFRQTLPHWARLWMLLLKHPVSKNGTELLSKSSSNSLLLKSIKGGRGTTTSEHKTSLPPPFTAHTPSSGLKHTNNTWTLYSVHWRQQAISRHQRTASTKTFTYFKVNLDKYSGHSVRVKKPV